MMRPTRVGDNVVPSVQNYTDKATVRAVQAALKAKGFDPGAVDGVYGPNTAAAVKKMQSAIGADPSGKIDSGVLATLQVSAPSAASVQQAMTDAAAVSTATQKMHASEANDPDTTDQAKVDQQKAVAQAAVDAAKKQVTTAATPAQKQVAQTQLVVAQQKLDALPSSSFFMRTVLGRPAWQVMLFGLGGLLLTVGVVTLIVPGKKAARR